MVVYWSISVLQLVQLIYAFLLSDLMKSEHFQAHIIKLAFVCYYNNVTIIYVIEHKGCLHFRVYSLIQ